MIVWWALAADPPMATEEGLVQRLGNASCNAIQPPRSIAYIANPASPDPGLIVLGGAGATRERGPSGNGLSITGQLSAGAGCTTVPAAGVSCAAPPLRSAT